MEKSPDAFRTISEVSELLETPAHVLRFWESRFPQIRPVKRAGGRRYYRPTDVDLLLGIKRLLHDDGVTIRGVQKILREQGVRFVLGVGEPEVPEAAMDVDTPVAAPAKTSVVPFTRLAASAADEPDLFTGVWVADSPETADAAKAVDDASLWKDDNPADNSDSALPNAALPDPDATDPAENSVPAVAPASDSVSVTENTAAQPEPEQPTAVINTTPQPSPTDQNRSATAAGGAVLPTKVSATDNADAWAAAPPKTPAEILAKTFQEVPAENTATQPAVPPPEPEAAASDGATPNRADTESQANATDVAAKQNPTPAPPDNNPAAPDNPDAISGHWLAADLRALQPADLASQAAALLPLAKRLKGLRDRVADLGRVPRR